MPKSSKDTPDTETPAQEPAPAPPSTIDVDSLIEENVAMKAQQDQMLDMIVELKEKLEALEQHGTTPAGGPIVNAEEVALNAELAALKEEFAEYPAIDLVERRVLLGADANNEIRLMDEPGLVEDPTGTARRWKLRWFNFAKEGRASQAEREGYIKVRWAELRSSESIGALERKDDYVRQGDRGLEVLCKMPLKLFDYKKRRDAARNQGLLTSESRLRDHLSGNVAAMASRDGQNADQAGSFVHGKTFSLEIKKGETERVTV